MSPDILRELVFLWHALFLGMVLSFFYDWFLIARRLISHGTIAASVEDLLFWAIFAISIFVLLYKENNGALRWFAVAGTFAGIFLYKKTISGFFIKYAVRIGTFLIGWLKKLFSYMGKPFRLAKNKLFSGCQKTGVAGRRLGKYLKKKLTAYLKLFKITVDKQ